MLCFYLAADPGFGFVLGRWFSLKIPFKKSLAKFLEPKYLMAMSWITPFSKCFHFSIPPSFLLWLVRGLECGTSGTFGGGVW